jgi:hypothetical protein
MSLLGSRDPAGNVAANVARPVSSSRRGTHILDFFARAKVHPYFRARSANRDVESDHARVALVSRSIEWSLRAAEAERTGLLRRLEVLTARAVVPLGNGTDEYLTRDASDTRRLGQLEQEIQQAERRLEQLARDIVHFDFLRMALLVRFPDFRPPSENH